MPLTRRTGTPVFMAPELYQRQYSFPADLWSCGMMLYQLVSGRFPFWCEHLTAAASDRQHDVPDPAVRAARPRTQALWLPCKS